jgi:hypothetical protein
MAWSMVKGKCRMAANDKKAALLPGGFFVG